MQSVSIRLFVLCIADKPVGTQLSPNTIKPLVNTSVLFICTSNAVPVPKYRFFRVDGSGEREVSSYNSDNTGILMVSSIMHTSSVYIVTYKCIPYNLLGNGLEQTVMIDIQGTAISSTVELALVGPSPDNCINGLYILVHLFQMYAIYSLQYYAKIFKDISVCKTDFHYVTISLQFALYSITGITSCCKQRNQVLETFVCKAGFPLGEFIRAKRIFSWRKNSIERAFVFHRSPSALSSILFWPVKLFVDRLVRGLL